MKKEKVINILSILRNAIKAEQNAFMDYINGANKIDIPELKGILLYLAEEERKHKIILIQEYNTMKKRIGKIKTNEIRFKIPKNYPFKRLQTISGIDLSGISMPTAIIGGDYFDTFLIKDEEQGIDRLGIIFYDAMGHGLPATYIKSITRELFQKRMERFYKKKDINTISPSHIVTEINKLISKECQKKDAFVTLFYCIIDPAKKELIYTSAGHEPPIYIMQNGKIIEETSITQLLLGFDENFIYKENKTNINPEDVFVLFSDGIIEAKDSEKNMFGREKIINTVLKNRKKSSSIILKKTINYLKEHTGKKFINDEISILVAKINL